MKEIDKIISKENDSIKETMRIVDEGAIGTALIVNDNNVLVGLVTDGDIRKAILKGVDITELIKKVMNINPVFLYEDDISNQHLVNSVINKLLKKSPTTRFIPILDSKKHIKDLALCSELKRGNYIRFTNKNSSNRAIPKKVLVVGGAGYLGSILVRKLLKKGYNVRILDLFLFGEESIESIKNDPNLEIMKGDIRNIETISDALKEVDAVVHLAALVGDPACNSNPIDTVEINYLATKVLAEACKYRQINRFIFASTCSVYGKGNGSLTEDSPLNPISLYAKSKIKSEDGILDMVDDNFSSCILRMGTLHGLSPRMRFDLVVNTLTMKAVTERKISIFGGSQWRPLLHVDDAAEAYIKCLEAPIEKIKGEIFNAGSNEQNCQIFQLGNFVREVMPETKVEITDKEIVQGQMDERDYNVSFDKISNILGYSTKKTVKDAILEIKKAIENKEIKNPQDKKYYNS